MWLSIAFFIAVLSKIQGLESSHITNNVDLHHLCVEKIIGCDFYRQPLSLYGDENIGIFTNAEDLQKACKDQAAYVQCITRAEEFCKEIVHFPMADQMFRNRRFPAELCSSILPLKQMYLKEAKCMNEYTRKVSKYCKEKMGKIKFLRHSTNLKVTCAHYKAIADCSAALLQDSCGYYAAYVMKRLLNFHYQYDYKCLDFEVVSEGDFFSSTPNYDTTEPIFPILEVEIPPKKHTDSMKNTDFEEMELDYLDKPVSENPPLDESFTFVDFEHLAPDELLKTTEDSISDVFNVDMDFGDLNMKQNENSFPSLPQHHYIHKNKTTFALYEDLEMGHMKYIGCGEADIFWVILSPPKSKYCTLMDLNLEYSESIFKCTVRIDAPCSSELDDEDKHKNAEIFHRRYVITVLSPPNNQRLDDMAIMNVHYLKVYPTSSTHSPEKKINVWSNQEHEDEEPKLVDRKGPSKMEDYSNNLYHYGNGSGQKKDVNSKKHSYHLDDGEDYESWDYYPLDEDDDADIYFPKSLGNEVIYIEDDNGALISLHDYRSPIYSNSLYQPHSLFRPRIGTMPDAREDPWEFEDKMNIVNSREHCSAEEPCSPNSEIINKLGIKPGMYIDLQNIETFDQFKDLNLKRGLLLKSATNVKEGIFEELYSGSTQAYVVTPSARIKFPKLK